MSIQFYSKMYSFSFLGDHRSSFSKTRNLTSYVRLWHRYLRTRIRRMKTQSCYIYWWQNLNENLALSKYNIWYSINSGLRIASNTKVQKTQKAKNINRPGGEVSCSQIQTRIPPCIKFPSFEQVLSKLGKKTNINIKHQTRTPQTKTKRKKVIENKPALITLNYINNILSIEIL